MKKNGIAVGQGSAGSSVIGARASGASVPGRFRCSFSGGIPFGRRGPVLPLPWGPHRWLVLWAARSYLAAVCRACPVRRAFAWRVLAVLSPRRFAPTFSWWVQHITQPVAA